MNKKRVGAGLVCAVAGVLAISSVMAQEKSPGFNQKIPESIMTPNKVETRFGTLDFVDGAPTEETAQKCFNNLDYIRGVETFLNFIPAASVEALRRGTVERGASKCNQAIIFDQLADSNPLFLTANTCGGMGGYWTEV